MTVKVFKLINGEEIISAIDVNKAFEERVFLDKPAMIVMQQSERGMGVGLAPFMPYAAGEIELNRAAIAAEAAPDPKMAAEYNRIFGSGIEIAPASVLANLR